MRKLIENIHKSNKNEFLLVKLNKVIDLISLKIKYYIYSMICKKNKPSLQGAISSIKTLYETSKFIAKKNNYIEDFTQKWAV